MTRFDTGGATTPRIEVQRHPVPWGALIFGTLAIVLLGVQAWGSYRHSGSSEPSMPVYSDRSSELYAATEIALRQTEIAVLTAPSPTPTPTSTPLPKPIPTSTPIPLDAIYPACAPDTPGGTICRPEPPPETPTPYPLCADGSYPLLCMVPTSVMHGMTEVETE